MNVGAAAAVVGAGAVGGWVGFWASVLAPLGSGGDDLGIEAFGRGLVGAAIGAAGGAGLVAAVVA